MSNLLSIKLFIRDTSKRGIKNFPIRGKYLSGAQANLSLIVERLSDEKGYVTLSLLPNAKYDISVMTTKGIFKHNATISTDSASKKPFIIIGLSNPINDYISTRELRVVDLDDKPVANCKFKMVYLGKTIFQTVGADGKKQIKSLVGEPVTITVLKPDNSEVASATFTYTSHKVKGSNFRLKMPIHQGQVTTAPNQPTTPQPLTPPLQGMHPFLAECIPLYQGELLDESDYIAAANLLNCDVAAIKAVAKVESPHGAFQIYQGHKVPTILFERHKFHSFTNHIYDTSHPNISAANAGGYGPSSAQYPKLELALGLNEVAALRACSWGKFQIMGFNYQAAGFSDVKSMVKAMFKNEKEQLKAFIHFIQADTVRVSAIRNHQWATFAAHYNGSNYAINDYDTNILHEFNYFVSHPNALP